MCFGCSKEPSHCDGSFEHSQHIFWMRNKENSFPIRTLIWRPAITFCPIISCAAFAVAYILMYFKQPLIMEANTMKPDQQSVLGHIVCIIGFQSV